MKLTIEYEPISCTCLFCKESATLEPTKFFYNNHFNRWDAVTDEGVIPKSWRTLHFTGTGVKNANGPVCPECLNKYGF